MTQRKKQNDTLAAQAVDVANMQPIILLAWDHEGDNYRVVATSTEIVCERADGQDAMGVPRWQLVARVVRAAWKDDNAPESVRTTRALLAGFESLLVVARESAPCAEGRIMSRALSLKEAGRVRRRLRDVLRGYPSQRALAAKLGLRQQTVSGVLSGQSFAGWRFARAFAKLTGHPSAEALVSESYPPADPASAATT